MTDSSPQGHKRRGSTELKTEELDIAPTLAASSQQSNKSRREVSFVAAPDATATETTTATTTTKTANRQNGHRRRNTDGNVNFTASGTSFLNGAVNTSNTDVIKMMANDLRGSARLDFQKKANDLTVARELKHAQIELRELKEQQESAVKIIGNLQAENEDFIQQMETLRTELDVSQTELRISQQKISSMQELYRSDTAKYQEEMDSSKQQLSELSEDLNKKDMQLSEAKQYQKMQEMQERVRMASIHGDDHDGTHDDPNNMDHHPSRQQQHKEQQMMDSHQQQLADKDRKIDSLLLQLEGNTRAQHEKVSLQKEMDSLTEVAKHDLLLQKEQMEKMQLEILQLASRNSQLQRENDDLVQLLEERDYEAQMLRTGYGLHRNQATKGDMTEIANQLQFGASDMDDGAETFENLEFMAADDGDMAMDAYEAEASQETERQSRSHSPKHKKPAKEVADVTREYLHLTASVVSMKFPRIRDVSSEELINKVKNYNFWEYHDMMVRIMRTEEQKMLAKAKAQHQQQQAETAANGGGGDGNKQATGVLSRFRQFWGGAGGAAGNKNGVGGQQRRGVRGSSLSKETNPQQRKRSNTASAYIQTRKQSKSNASVPVAKPPAPPANGNGNGNSNNGNENAKNKMKDMLGKAKEVKATAIKAVTGVPTDKEQDGLSGMEFQGVPFVGAPKNENDAPKPKKPDQGL